MGILNKLHKTNLIQLKSAVRAPQFKDGIWFHGDGNMYTSEKESNDRAAFHNDHPANVGARYRKHFTKTDAIPDSLEEMEKQLVAANQAEAEKRNLEQTTPVNQSLAFDMIPDEDADPAPDPAPTGKGKPKKNPA